MDRSGRSQEAFAALVEEIETRVRLKWHLAAKLQRNRFVGDSQTFAVHTRRQRKRQLLQVLLVHYASGYAPYGPENEPYLRVEDRRHDPENPSNMEPSRYEITDCADSEGMCWRSEDGTIWTNENLAEYLLSGLLQEPDP